jgi:hypothetical protein
MSPKLIRRIFDDQPGVLKINPTPLSIWHGANQRGGVRVQLLAKPVEFWSLESHAKPTQMAYFSSRNPAGMNRIPWPRAGAVDAGTGAL